MMNKEIDYSDIEAEKILRTMEPSDWECYLFSNHGGGGITWIPEKGKVPNFIVRFFMRVLLGCHWHKLT